MLESLKQMSSVLAASPHPLSLRERGESWTGVDPGPRPASYDAEWDHCGGCRWEGSKSAGKEAQGGTYSKVKETVWAVRKRGVGRWLPEAAEALRHLSAEAACSGLWGHRGKRRLAGGTVKLTPTGTWIWAALLPGSEPASQGTSPMVQSGVTRGSPSRTCERRKELIYARAQPVPGWVLPPWASLKLLLWE